MVLNRAPASDFGSTLHAVLIGVDELPDNWLPKLSVAARDAKAFAETLALPSGCAVPASQIHALTGPAAARESVVAAIQHAAASASADGSVIIYFAGHGLVSNDVFFLCTTGARPEALSDTALSSADLEFALNECKARGILVILDCCEGGAFAEVAPATFTRLRAGEYRLLMSASRADQRSWEAADGSGTLFSKALLGVLSGEIQVGRVAGAIYFSDLVEAIDANIAEGLERRPEHPQQEMMFVGAYVRDPLLFVHRGLSLAQVNFATARYSLAHIRRILWRSAAIVAATTLFVTTVAYGLQNQTQFARVDNGKLVLLRGQPAYNLPGYPQLLWTLPYGPERLDRDPGSNGFVRVAPLGQPIMPVIEAHLRADYQLLGLLESGRHSEARASALAVYADPRSPFDQRLNAGLVLARVATKEDTSLLKGWLTGERKELRLAAFLALLRLHETEGPSIDKVLDGEEIAEHQDIVRAVEGPCSDQLARYLERRFSTRSSHPTNADVLDAALRADCKLSIESLVLATTRPHLFGEKDVAFYARHIGKERALAEALLKRLDIGDLDVWSAAGLIGTIAEMRDAPCSPSFATGLRSPILASRLMAMAAISRHCESPRWSASFNRAEKHIVVSIEANGKVETLALNPRENEESLAIQYLVDLPELGLPVAGLADAIRELLPVVEDTQLRAKLIGVLIRERDQRPLPSDLTDSNSLEVRAKVVELRRFQKDPQLVAELLARLGGSDDFYVGLVGRLSLSNEQLDKLRPLVEGSEDERRQGACVLAMQDSIKGVVKLLTNPDWNIRGQAVSCAPYNDQAQAILAATPRSVDGFPIEGYSTLETEVRRKSTLTRKLQALPADERLWRLNLVDKTPGGFGIWGQGMRQWIAEQTFELAAGTEK